MTYKIVFFPSEEKSKIADSLRRRMNDRGAKEIVDGDFEYVFVIGGDGSFLYFSKQYFNQSKKIVGIRNGNTAFLSNFSLEDLDNLDSFNWKSMDFLVLTTKKNKYLAANDIYFMGDLLLDAKVEIDGCFLEKFRGSGLLLSTKRGSTAKNKSMNGPILIAKEKIWLLNEIGPFFTHKNNSLGTSAIISSDNSLKIKAGSKFRVYIDGMVENELSNEEEFEISLQEGAIKTVDIGLDGYINKLRNTFVIS